MWKIVKVSDLHDHPRNIDFFDDIMGEQWDEFLESVKTSGIISPIVVTDTMTIISGHQRVRACEELGIEEILAEVKENLTEDEILKQLLETNIRQRGSISSSAVKMGRIVTELERLYGIRNGGDRGNQHTGGRTARCGSATESDPPRTQAELASMLGVTTDTIARAKKLLTLPTEWQDLIDKGVVTTKVVTSLVSKLPDTDKQKLAEMLPTDSKTDRKQMQQYIDQIQERDNQIKGYQMKLEKTKEYERQNRQLESENKALESENRRLEKLANIQPETVEIEVAPPDYNDVKKENGELRQSIAQSNAEKEHYRAQAEQYQKELASMVEAAENGVGDTEQAIANISASSMKTDAEYCLNVLTRYNGLLDSSEKITVENKSAICESVTNIVKWANGFLEFLMNDET